MITSLLFLHKITYIKIFSYSKTIYQLMNPADQKLKSSILTEIQEHMDEIKRNTHEKNLWKKMFDTINNFNDTEFWDPQ